MAAIADLNSINIQHYGKVLNMFCSYMAGATCSLLLLLLLLCSFDPACTHRLYNVVRTSIQPYNIGRQKKRHNIASDVVST